MSDFPDVDNIHSDSASYSSSPCASDSPSQLSQICPSFNVKATFSEHRGHAAMFDAALLLFAEGHPTKVCPRAN